MDKEQFDQIKKISDIPNFPYSSYEAVKVDIEKKNISIGAAMDRAREWVMSGMAGRYVYMVTSISALMYFLLPLAIIIYFVVQGQYLNILYAIPTFVAFLMLRPIAMNLGIFFKLIVWVGYGLLLAYIFDYFTIWSLYLGFSIIIPWRINKLIYSTATNRVISKSEEDEESFVMLYKYRVIGIKKDDNSILWFDSNQ